VIVAAVLGAVITGGFGLLSSGKGDAAGGTVSANGGHASNINTCVGGGAYVRGTVNCSSRPQSSAAQLVHFSTYVQHEPGGNWIVPHPKGFPPSPGECLDPEIARRAAWLESQHGIESELMRIRLQVVNDSSETLVFQHLGFASYEHLSRVTGHYYIECLAEGGPVAGEHIEIDLHSIPPTLEFQNEGYETTMPFSFSPTHGEPAVFYIQASTLDEGLQNGYLYRWTLDLSYTLGGRSGTYIIDNRGKPFELTDTRVGR
jgi:hypothetical protein